MSRENILVVAFISRKTAGRRRRKNDMHEAVLEINEKVATPFDDAMLRCCDAAHKRTLIQIK